MLRRGLLLKPLAIRLVESVSQVCSIHCKPYKALSDSQYNDVVLPCFYLVMIIFGLIGNIIVIYVTNKQKRKSVVDQYVKNLAIAGKKNAPLTFSRYFLQNQLTHTICYISYIPYHMIFCLFLAILF